MAKVTKKKTKKSMPANSSALAKSVALLLQAADVLHKNRRLAIQLSKSEAAHKHDRYQLHALRERNLALEQDQGLPKRIAAVQERQIMNASLAKSLAIALRRVFKTELERVAQLPHSDIPSPDIEQIQVVDFVICQLDKFSSID
jgi:hypothetical protein